MQTIIDTLASAVADAVVRRLQLAPSPFGASGSRWLSVKEAAEYARIGKWTVYTAIRSGKLPARQVGHRLLIDRNDLDTWIQGMPPANGR